MILGSTNKKVMTIFIALVAAFVLIIFFIVFAARKKAKGEKLGEREPGAS
jgi:preprotein translocase subunit YajC